jgi:hypothetical protein
MDADQKAGVDHQPSHPAVQSDHHHCDSTAMKTREFLVKTQRITALERAK